MAFEEAFHRLRDSFQKHQSSGPKDREDFAVSVDRQNEQLGLMKRLEIQTYLDALLLFDNNKKQAAELLGVSVDVVYVKWNALELDKNLRDFFEQLDNVSETQNKEQFEVRVPRENVWRRIYRAAFERIFFEVGGSRAETARQLGVCEKTVYRKVRKYNLDPDGVLNGRKK